jgi:hypothetical protein
VKRAATIDSFLESGKRWLEAKGHVSKWHLSPWRGLRAERQLCPAISDVDLLGDLERVVDFDTEIANGPEL